ncbi:Arrestin domain-containing protein 3 [Labeo rohita]|uniref:Arrestin domain-containing protein 3 n=1 Tax=Labeo rohita TaxID=84645 RepID=A0ABQ8MNK8_LABRO|nr:Arrestin domain-containing protein 3 [Labeo rohita]
MFFAEGSTNGGCNYIVKETRDLIPSGQKSKIIVDLTLPHDLTVTIENCRIIKMWYQLKVSLGVSFASDPAVRFPVVILPPQHRCPPWQGPTGRFQPYPPPQPNLVPYPGKLPHPPAGLYEFTMLPHPGAAAEVYPNPNAVLPHFLPAQCLTFPGQRTAQKAEEGGRLAAARMRTNLFFTRAALKVSRWRNFAVFHCRPSSLHRDATLPCGFVLSTELCTFDFFATMVLGKVKSFIVSYDCLNDSNVPVFSSGDSVSGRVIIEVTGEIRVKSLKIHAKGFAKVRWTESRNAGSNTAYTQNYTEEVEYLNHRDILIGHERDDDNSEEGLTTIHSGRHEYAFSFELPQTPLATSFEGKHGSVRYWVKAELHRPWLLPMKTKKEFTVFEHIDINTPLLLSPQAGTKEKTLCCWFCTSGPISLSAKIERKGYTPGESIQIFAEIENCSSRMVVPKAAIYQTQTFFAKGKMKEIKQLVANIRGESLSSGKTETWNGKMLKIPPVSPSILDCSIIRVEYSLMVYVDIPGAMNLSLNLPLVIGTIPLHPFGSRTSSVSSQCSMTMSCSSSLCRGGHRRTEAELFGSVVRAGKLRWPAIRLHPGIKPHQLRSRDSTPARHAEKRMARVQSDWALEAFTFVYLPMTAIVRFAVTTERKQTSMGKTRSKGAGSHWQITRPRYLAPVDGTRPVGLNLQSFVKVVTLLMLFSKG